MIPTHFVAIDKLPLTTTGKIDRKTLRALEIDDDNREFKAPGNMIEKEIAHIWSDILHIPVEKIGVAGDFFTLGGHSLNAHILISRIHKRLDVKLSLADVFKSPTIRELAQCITSAQKSQYKPLLPVEQKEYYQLSPAQKRMYVLQQLENNDTVYNIPSLYQMEGALNKKQLEHTFQQLIQQHESLRTSFIQVNKKPVQRILREVEFHVENLPGPENPKKSNETVETIWLDFIKPFDLADAPLLHVGLMPIQSEQYLLMVDMHHIISDLVSAEILTRNFINVYSGKSLPKIKLQYKDYAIWQNHQKEQGEISRQSKYWATQLTGELPQLNFPTDFVRPPIPSFKGETITRTLSKEDTQQLHRLALQEGATLYMVALAMFYILLFKITRQDDIIIGTPVVGRRHPDLEKIIGIFMNILVLRNYPRGELTYAGFLQEVKEKTIKAYDNQDIQFEEIVEKVLKNREMNRNPLFDVMFDFQVYELGLERIPEEVSSGMKIKIFPYEANTSKVDFNLIATEVNGRINISLEYSTDLFKKETMETLLKHYETIMRQVTNNQEIKIKNIGLMEQDDSEEIKSRIQKDMEKLEESKRMSFDI
jgi:acyl carrier protein